MLHEKGALGLYDYVCYSPSSRPTRCTLHDLSLLLFFSAFPYVS
jgi:hypothetical protein